MRGVSGVLGSISRSSHIPQTLGIKIMSEVFITYEITISEEELDIIEAIVESYKEDNLLHGILTQSVEDAIITGILEQIVTPNKE